MEPTTPQQTPDAPRPIETASATTSPSNSSSGPLAYIVALLALLACFAMGLLAKGCTTLVGEVVGDEMLNDHGVLEELWEDSDPWDESDDFDDDAMGWNDVSERVPLVDVLDEDLALYSSIDSLVGASAYANVRRDVSDAVRSLVLVDRDATNEIATLLRTSAVDEDLARDAVTKAQELSADAYAKLEETNMPEIGGEDADDINEQLTKAKDHTLNRWLVIQSELEALSAGDSLRLQSISELDDDVADETETAVEAFLEALSIARHL